MSSRVEDKIWEIESDPIDRDCDVDVLKSGCPAPLFTMTVLIQTGCMERRYQRVMAYLFLLGDDELYNHFKENEPICRGHEEDLMDLVREKYNII